MWKRDIQGKFALKNDDYRQVRSLRLTDDTWKALGIAAECLGMTRADYLSHLISGNALTSIARQSSDFLAPTSPKNESQHSITPNHESHQIPGVSELVILRDRVLSELKLGKQATGYKTALKALNRFITELTS
ncbi:hypothetical protein [Anabaena sp. CCY 0017]|uniref:hypothetical protein n=1 Tax=Anabaena sp. CCY 0017 TaxID=3103866 RepID=UPI0039C637C9